MTRLSLTPISLALMNERRETPLFTKRGVHMSIPTFLLLRASYKNAMNGIPRGAIPVDPLRRCHMAKPKMPKFPSWRDAAGKLQRYCFQLFKAKDGWRWRMWARNGRCIAESGEGYGANKAVALRMLRVVRGDRPIPVWLP